MRVDADPEGIRHVRYLLALGDPAGGARIGLQDIDRPLGQDPAKPPAGELGLASGDRDAKRRLDLPVALHVFGRDGLLKPGDVEFLDLPSEADRGGCVIGVIGVDHDRHRVANGPAYLAAQTDVVVDAKAELELDRTESRIGALPRLVA